MKRLTIMTLLLAGSLVGQDAYLQKWTESRASQRPDAKLEVTLPKTTFYMGEIIPLKLTFTSTNNLLEVFTLAYDRSGRQDSVEKFVVDPAESLEDPLKGKLGGFGGGIFSTPPTLSGKPYILERDLNEWVRFTKPGTYRVYVMSWRIYPKSQMNNPVLLTSNMLSFEVLSTPPEWAAEQLASAVRILDKPLPFPRELAEQEANRQERINAARVLRFLDTREAAEVLVKRWEEASANPSSAPPEWGELGLGVRSSPFVDAAGHLKP